MEETYNLKAIILNHRPSGEDDGKIILYSRELGKQELTARGVKKIKSKLAGHLEPFNLVDLMVIHGRQYDYVGGAVSEKCCPGIKSNLAKVAAAGQATRIVIKLIKPGVADEAIFELLFDYLNELEIGKGEPELLYSFFTLKFLSRLGNGPELSFCLKCHKKILPGKNRFDLAKGGLVCGQCSNYELTQLTISDDAIKLLRLADKEDFKKLTKIKINKKLEKEIEKIVNSFYSYHF